VNFGLLTAEICWRVSGTPANFNGFRVLAALLHGTLVLGVSQTLRRLTEGATYIQQGNHHITLGIGCIQDSVAVVNATRNDVLVMWSLYTTNRLIHVSLWEQLPQYRLKEPGLNTVLYHSRPNKILRWITTVNNRCKLHQLLLQFVTDGL